MGKRERTRQDKQATNPQLKIQRVECFGSSTNQTKPYLTQRSVFPDPLGWIRWNGFAGRIRILPPTNPSLEPAMTCSMPVHSRGDGKGKMGGGEWGWGKRGGEGGGGRNVGFDFVECL